MGDDIIQFLKQRNVATQKIEEEKLDSKVILLLEDAELKEYIPAYGDRVALKEFCRKIGSPAKLSKKKTLIQRIRKRLRPSARKTLFHSGSDTNSSNEDTEGTSTTTVGKNKGNTHALKVQRRIEIGWLMEEKNGKQKQVRGPTGGGTRHLLVEKSTKMEQIQKLAIDLYFPRGLSPRGKIGDFRFQVLDFKHQPISMDTSVEQVYDRSKMRLLRFYLCTTPLNSESTTHDNLIIVTDNQKISKEENDESDESLPSIENILKRKRDLKKPLHQDDHSYCNSSISTAASTTNFEDLLLFPSDEEIQFGPISGGITNCDLTIPISGQNNLEIPIDIIVPSLSVENADINLASTSEVNITNRSELVHVPIYHSSHHQQITVHRGNVLREMMSIFSDPSVMQTTSYDVRMILPNGRLEQGIGDGVLKDCLTEFWGEFLEQCCVGNQQKVPTIRHDFQEQEWLSIGRIIYKGWQVANYFPISMSCIVMECALYGKTQSDLLENFLQFINEGDSIIFRKAIGDYHSVEFDDLMEALEVHSCRSVVTKNNIVRILEEIAHKEMVQECKYITDTWSKILNELGAVLTPQYVIEIYKNMEPTTKKVAKMVQFPFVESMSNIERETMNHLLRYIRELDKNMLKLFLRYCTGSDLILNVTDKIIVEFVNLEGIQRRPVAHTCGMVLKLPRNYESFTIFRAEFNSILNSSVWVMDIV